MSRYNSCLKMAKACPHASVLGDCQAEVKTCDKVIPFILNDKCSEQEDDGWEFFQDKTDRLIKTILK